MNKIVALVALVVVLVGGWILMKNSGQIQSESDNAPVNTNSGITATQNTSSSTSTSTPSSTQGAVKEFTVTGNNFSFSPSTMTVNKGDTVKITFVNSVGFHDFVLDEFGVATKQVNGGQSEVVTFVADKAGTFEYYCSVGKHREMGMKGTLVVK